MTEQQDKEAKILAEKLMGWTVRMGSPGDLPRYFSTENQEGFLWAPNDYIADAWMLIDKLRESGKWCCILLDSDFHYVWEVKLTEYAEDATPHVPTVRSGCCESVCDAICAAALKTIEEAA